MSRDAADHRHQQPRGVDVRLGQAADAADHHGAVDAYFAARAPEARERVLAAYPDYPRRRALVAFGSDAMFGAPAWAFADAYSAHAPTYVYRFDHTAWTLRVLGLGATHGSEIVHIQHSYARTWAASCTRSAGGCSRRWAGGCSATWLDFAHGWEPLADDWPRYDTERRRTRVIRSTATISVDDPDAVRRAAWERPVLTG